MFIKFTEFVFDFQWTYFVVSNFFYTFAPSKDSLNNETKIIITILTAILGYKSAGIAWMRDVLESGDDG